MAICLSVLLFEFYKLIISTPLSKGNLTVTNSRDLQNTLLQFKKRRSISYCIFLPIITAALIWFAFEMREAFTERLLGFSIDETKGNIIFGAIILLTVLSLLLNVTTTYSTLKDIDNIVEDINELKLQ